MTRCPSRASRQIQLGWITGSAYTGGPAIEPLEILRCLTSNAAELLRIDVDHGSIAVGYRADSVAMPTNPLKDIESLRRIDFVMKSGRIIPPTVVQVGRTWRALEADLF